MTTTPSDRLNNSSGGLKIWVFGGCAREGCRGSLFLDMSDRSWPEYVCHLCSRRTPIGRKIQLHLVERTGRRGRPRVIAENVNE